MTSAEEVVLLSRIQFALTAMYHFIFVPLTLGLATLLAIMETVYVMTGREIWKTMTKYWGILFGINFAMGVATGITMEFQFGTNWAYYAHYVGDVFGAPLAIEGLMAFFLEATFVGLFFFAWDRLSRVQHLVVTYMVALGSSLSALWILIANGWMQYPVGSYFDVKTFRMEITSLSQVIFNPVAQAKFVHTISAGYVTGAVFVLAISSYFLLRKRNVEFAKRSFTVAASFGLASALCVVVLGDTSGYLATQHQEMKVASLEGMWRTEKPPASFNLFGIPIQSEHITKYRVRIPDVLGLLTTHSLTKPLRGINQLVHQADTVTIPEGLKAYKAVVELKQNPNNAQAQAAMKKYGDKLGYALLLNKYTNNPLTATPKQIQKAAWDIVPGSVISMFFSFRVMVACGFFFIATFAFAFYLSCKRNFGKRWYLWLSLWTLPLPWFAAECGWFIAEHGRQPWVVYGMLPTFLGSSTLQPHDLWISLSGFVLFYTALAIVEIYLMVKYIRLGPDGLAKSHP